jgi:hypothetical protein
MEVARANYAKIKHPVQEGDKTERVLGYSDSRLGKMAERIVSRGGEVVPRKERYTVKIAARGVEIFLIPTRYQYEALGGELVSTVVLKQDGQYRFHGHLAGCLLSVGADLDGDGIPEIIMETCDNNEGKSDDYIKLYPAIKPLMFYSID